MQTKYKPDWDDQTRLSYPHYLCRIFGKIILKVADLAHMAYSGKV